MSNQAAEMPHSSEIEAALLGALLVDPVAVEQAEAFLDDPAKLYDPRNAKLYGAMLTLRREGKLPDRAAIVEYLRRRDQLSAEDVIYLGELIVNASMAPDLETYTRTVTEDAMLRDLITGSADIAKLAYHRQHGAAEIAEMALAIVSAATRSIQVGGEFVSISDVLDATYTTMTSGEIPGVRTNWFDFDTAYGGLYPTDLTILAGRPSHGKTSAAWTLAVNVAEQDYPVLFYSLEMSSIQLGQRMLAMLSGENLQTYRRGRFSNAQLKAMAEAVTVGQRLPIYLDETTSQSITAIRAKALRWAARNGRPGLILLDYIQYVEVPMRRGENWAIALGAVSRGLKRLARELECPVVALSQLSRDIERRADPVPTMADLAESGKIEQDADNIVFIVRPDVHDPKSDRKGIADMYVRKCRNGPTGKFSLRFNGAVTRLENLDTQH